MSTENIVNGKYYPMWQSLVDKKSEYVGGKIFNYDMGMKAESVIADMGIRPNGKDSAYVFVEDTDGEEWGWDVRIAGVIGNNTDEPGLAISGTYVGVFVLQKPTPPTPTKPIEEG